MPAIIITCFQILQLLTLQTLFVEHVWIEERADVLVISFEALQYEEGGDDKENLRLATLQLFRELFVLLSRSLYY